MLLRGRKQRYQVRVTPSHLCQDWKWRWEHVVTVTASAQEGINSLFSILVKEKKANGLVRIETTLIKKTRKGKKTV